MCVCVCVCVCDRQCYFHHVLKKKKKTALPPSPLTHKQKQTWRWWGKKRLYFESLCDVCLCLPAIWLDTSPFGSLGRDPSVGTHTWKKKYYQQWNRTDFVWCSESQCVLEQIQQWKVGWIGNYKKPIMTWWLFQQAWNRFDYEAVQFMDHCARKGILHMPLTLLTHSKQTFKNDFATTTILSWKSISFFDNQSFARQSTNNTSQSLSNWRIQMCMNYWFSFVVSVSKDLTWTQINQCLKGAQFLSTHTDCNLSMCAITLM